MNNLNKAIKFYQDVKSKRGYFPDNVLFWQLFGKFSPALLRIIGTKNVQIICNKRHQVTLDFLKSKFSAFLKDYHFYKSAVDNQKIIWSLWLQGYDNAPELVKATLKSSKKYAELHGYRFILLDEESVLEYVELPKFLLEKRKKGLISHTAFADLLRVALLSKHGGVWIDSTVYIEQDFPVSELERTFFSLKTGEYEDFSPNVAKNRWKTFLLAGNSVLFTFVRDFLFEYYKKYDLSVDYLLIDYVFELGYQLNQNIKSDIDVVPISNLNLFWLERNLGSLYEQEKWAQITENTHVFKTTYKLPNEILHSNNSFYKYLLINKL
ncbi:Mannosyltransferase OCH1 and related enzymes [[Pasteurella] aerogenes]|nr:Mannosyltransferase OCH1 and related enzymes [[Pasteurella] aerogenes]